MPINVSIEGGDLRPDQAQALPDGAFDGDQVWVQYQTQHDTRVRPSHAALDGTFWRADDMQAPAPPLDYGCFLPGATIEGIFDGASRAFYSGKAVEILTKGGLRLRVTPNHPIPTENGVVAAGTLKPGGKIGRHLAAHVRAASGKRVNENYKPTAVEDVFHALAEHGGVSRTGNSGHEFHGDASAIDGEIEIVGSYRILRNVWDSQLVQQSGELALAGAHVAGSAPGVGLRGHGGARGLAPLELDLGSSVCGADLVGALSGGHSGPFDGFRFRLTAELDASGQQALGYGGTHNAKTIGYRVDGLPLLIRIDQFANIDWREMQCLRLGQGPHLNACLYQPDADGLGLNPVFLADVARAHPGVVELDDVTEVTWFDYTGHVYDLRSPLGYVIADGAVASNCRCYLRYVAAPGSVASRVLPEAVAKVPAGADPAAVAKPAVLATRAEAYATYLDTHLPEWRDVAEIASKAVPAKRIEATVAAIQAAAPDATDVRELATMIVEAMALRDKKAS